MDLILILVYLTKEPFFSTPILWLKNPAMHINLLQNPIVSLSKVSMSVIIMFLSFVVLMANDLSCTILSISLTNLYFISQTCSMAFCRTLLFPCQDTLLGLLRHSSQSPSWFQGIVLNNPSVQTWCSHLRLATFLGSHLLPILQLGF